MTGILKNSKEVIIYNAFIFKYIYIKVYEKVLKYKNFSITP